MSRLTIVERDWQNAREVRTPDRSVRKPRLEGLEERLEERFTRRIALRVVSADGVVFRVATRDDKLVRKVVVFVDDHVERGEVVLADDRSQSIDNLCRRSCALHARPISKPRISGCEDRSRLTNIYSKAFFYLRESADLNGREVELEDEERVAERRRVAPDLGIPKKFLKAVLKVDVVVVREHRADNRLAEPLRAQEHRRRDFFQTADIRRIVHKKAFAD